MNQVYRALDISKQAFHQQTNRHLGLLEEQQQLLPVIADIRKDHPQMSSRQIYHML